MDIGSDVSLIIRLSTTQELNLTPKTKDLPELMGVTGKLLRLLGRVLVEIFIGLSQTIKQWLIIIVPDEYLTTDLLTGNDLLSQEEEMTVIYNKKIIVWGGIEYPLQYQEHRISTVKMTCPSNSTKKLFVKTSVQQCINHQCSTMYQYHQISMVKAAEPTHTTLLLATS